MTTVPLDEVAEILRGTVPAKPTDDRTGQRFFGIAEIGNMGAGPLRFVPHVEVGQHPTRVEADDIAIALLGRVGDTALVSDRSSGSVLGRECGLIRRRSDIVTAGWLYLWTQSADFKQQIAVHVSGSTMPRLSLSSLAKFTVPIPAYEDQVTIDEVLHGFDGAISWTRKVLGDLTELRQIEVDLTLARLEGTTRG